MEEVPQGFKNSQKVDIGIITKYSRLYLKTLFKKVYTVKGSTVADFRKMWGLQDNYSKKERINHVHHCIDAITMACMTKSNYELLAKFYHDWEELYQAGADAKPKVRKPWDSFVQDIKRVEDEILVSHYTPDNLPKKAKKILRKRGKKQKNDKGEFIYQKGDSVRGSLHKDTFYGAIERKAINKKTGEEEKIIKYVVRKSIEGLETSALKNIVDDRVREIVVNARDKEKQLKKEIDQLLKERKKADESQEQIIDKQVNEIKERMTLLYCMPNKNGSPIPIKKVRLYQPTVTNPLHIKKQRDKVRSGKRKEYKESYHVTNDGNYLMAIYEGKDKNGKLKRDFELINNIDSASFYTQKNNDKSIAPITKSGLTLRAMIKAGQLVLFWEDEPEELYSLPRKEQVKRLYKVIAFEADGRIQFRYQQTAMQQSSTNKEEMTITKFMKENAISNSFIDFVNPKLWLRLRRASWNFLVENIDFRISPIGEIERI